MSLSPLLLPRCLRRAFHHRRSTAVGTGIVAAAAAAVVLGYGVLPVLRAVVVARPPRMRVDVAPADFGFEAEDVAFPTERGETIRAWFVPPRNGAVVVLSHGYGGASTELLEPARWLRDYGYGVLAIDLAAHGRSSGAALALDGRDVRAAVRFVRGRGGTADGRIGLWGFSLGGIASVQAAALEPAVGAVVADGPFPVVAAADMPPPRGWRDELWIPFDTVQRAVLRWRGVAPAMGTIEALGRIAPRPVLLIAGLRNEGEARVVPHYAAAPGSGRQLWAVPDAGHVGSLGARREEYLNRALTLFDGALVRPSDRSSRAEGDTPAAPELFDEADVRRRTLAAMAAVTTWEQVVTVDERRADGWIMGTTLSYRHELPDRHTIHVLGTDVAADGTIVPSGPWDAIRIGPRYWTRHGSTDPYDCDTEAYMDETRPTGYLPDLDARLVGPDTSGGGTVYRFERGARTPSEGAASASAASASAAPPTRVPPRAVPFVAWWVDGFTFRVVRVERTYLNGDGHVESEGRTVGAFNSPPRIKPPGPCVSVGDD